MNQEERKILLNEIKTLICDNLEIYGKRWMFIKIYFRDALNDIVMEGSSMRFFVDISTYCERHGNLTELKTRLEEVFN